MFNIEFQEKLDEELSIFIDEKFIKYAMKHGVICDYTPFNFVAKDDNKVVGIITGKSYYKEVHISDLIVLEEYRGNDLGTKLVKTVEDYYKGKGFKNINLTTYEFQAPKFYKKCGYKVEFIRENKENPKLTKYYLVKYF